MKIAVHSKLNGNRSLLVALLTQLGLNDVLLSPQATYQSLLDNARDDADIVIIDVADSAEILELLRSKHEVLSQPTLLLHADRLGEDTTMQMSPVLTTMRKPVSRKALSLWLSANAFPVAAQNRGRMP